MPIKMRCVFFTHAPSGKTSTQNETETRSKGSFVLRSSSYTVGIVYTSFGSTPTLVI